MYPAFLGSNVCKEQPTGPVKAFNYVIKALLAMPGANQKGCFAVNGVACEHYGSTLMDNTSALRGPGGWYFNSTATDIACLSNPMQNNGLGDKWKNNHSVVVVSRFTVIASTLAHAINPIVAVQPSGPAFQAYLDASRTLWVSSLSVADFNTGVVIPTGTHAIAIKVASVLFNTVNCEVWLDGSKKAAWSWSGTSSAGVGVDASFPIGPSGFIVYGMTYWQSNTNLVVHMVALCDQSAPLAQLSKNPYSMFMPRRADPAYEYIQQQFLLPASDTSNSGWVQSTGGTLFGTLDEAYPNDSDYITANAAGSSCTIHLGAGSTPGMPIGGTSGAVLKYRLLAGNGQVAVSLKQGSTVIASFNSVLGSTAQTLNQALTVGQVNSITDFTNLSLTITAL